MSRCVYSTSIQVDVRLPIAPPQTSGQEQATMARTFFGHSLLVTTELPSKVVVVAEGNGVEVLFHAKMTRRRHTPAEHDDDV